jgi:hypothetical protein
MNDRRLVKGAQVMLSALNVLDTFTAVICYCDKTCPLALAIYFNLLFHKFN